MINFPLPGDKWRLVQKYGERPEVYAQFGMAGHNGIDIAPPAPGQTGVLIYAPHEGYIIVPPPEAHGYGNHVQIKSAPYLSNGMSRMSTLAHFETISVTTGEFVHQGDVLGVMGMSGFADGIHTHWTYKQLINGVVQNIDNGYKGAMDILKYCCHWTLPV